MKTDKPLPALLTLNWFMLLWFLSSIIPLYAASFNGVLYDASTDKPLEGVQIIFQPQGQSTTTARDGSFRLSLPPGEYQLIFFRAGYMRVEKPLSLTAAGLRDYRLYLEPTLLTLHEDVTVTAERDVRLSFHSPAAMTVVNLREASQPLPRTTPEALFGGHGIWLQKTNHGGGSPFIRGLTGNQVLTLIDGIRLNNATFRYGPNQYLNTVDPFSVDRIEVLRGYGATLYGSDAMGGVINLLTPALPFSATFTHSLAAAAKYSGELEKTSHVDWTLSGPRLSLNTGFSLRDFGDVRAGKGEGVQSPSGYSEIAGQIKGSVQAADQWLLTLLWQGVRQKEVPAYEQVAQRGYQFYFFDPQERQLAYLRSTVFSDRPYCRQFEITASYHDSEEGRERQKRNSSLQVFERDRVRTVGVQVQANSQWQTHWQMINGVEWYHDRVNSSTRERDVLTSQQILKRGLYPDNATATNLAFFSSHVLDLSPVSVHAGLRYNRFHIQIQDTLFGDVKLSPSALAGHLSLIYKVNQRFHALINAGSSFRAPNINDLSTFGPFDYGIEVPAIGLKPEYGYTLEAGVKSHHGQFSSTLLLYHTWLKDMITRVSATFKGSAFYGQDRVYQKANVQQAILRGIETEGEWQVGRRWRLQANLNYCFGQNLSDDEPMRRIPPLNGRVAVIYRFMPQWSCAAEAYGAATQDRLSSGDLADHRIPIGGTPGWSVWQLTVAWQRNDWTLSAGMTNLFDKAYKTHGSGIYMPGRTAWLALQVGKI